MVQQWIRDEWGKALLALLLLVLSLGVAPAVVVYIATAQDARISASAVALLGKDLSPYNCPTIAYELRRLVALKELSDNTAIQLAAERSGNAVAFVDGVYRRAVEYEILKQLAADKDCDIEIPDHPNPEQTEQEQQTEQQR